MNKRLVFQLISLIRSKPNGAEQFNYTLMAIIYYIPLSIERKNQKTDNDDELLGDDIYPLF